MSSNGQPACVHRLGQANEQTWLQMGSAAELMQEYDRAMNAYESALRHNNYSIAALSGIAALCRGREQFPRAVDYFQRILNIDQSNGEIWGALGHCYLMMDDLQKAYHAYQQALYHLPNPKEPKLWYGIGILYDRYGSLEHAEEAFSQVMRMEPKFEKANEIYFRLGIIYKQQQKYDQSLECFKYILHNPPRPLTEVDIWFQIGHVHEQQKNFGAAKEAYERVLNDNPNHAKVLQQLGWLYHQQSATFSNQDLAISYLTKSLESDGNDAQSWYLLGRCYMAQQKYNKAYEAYQQAVYRDGRNPTFWCSIGVLYYQINQFRDALDAYSRAIRLNPFISEVWYDLGTLYESCNNQVNDALDAYHRAAELDPTNPHIKQRLQMLRTQQAQGGQTTAPIPQDVNPQAYQSNGPMLGNPPTFAQPTPGPPGPPGMPTYGSRQDNKQPHPPISISPIHHGDSNHRDNLPPMSRGGELPMQRGDLPPMQAMSRRSPGPSGSYPQLREPRPPTPPNQHPLNNPVMTPHDQRSLTPHQPQQSQTPLRPDKRQSPPPTLPQIQDDNRRRYSSPPLRSTYSTSPRINDHGSSQHSGYHQPSHHEIPHHSPPIDRRDSDMYDHNKLKHTSEQITSNHEPHSHLSLEYRDPPSKPEETSVSTSLDHGSRVSILNNHQIVDQHDHRMHVDNGSVDDKFPPYRQDDHSIRRSSPIHLPEIKTAEGPSQQQRSSTANSPVRENPYGNENHSPVSSIPNDESQRKSSIDQHSNREISKLPFQEEQQQQSSHSSPPIMSRIPDNHQPNSPSSSPHDNEKPTLPPIRTNPPADRSISSTARQEDDDYDGTSADIGESSSTSGQKRSYSPSKAGENEIDERNREDLSKRPKTSPSPGNVSPTSSHSERERERERDQTRERRKSEQSANGSVNSPED